MSLTYPDTRPEPQPIVPEMRSREAEAWTPVYARRPVRIDRRIRFGLAAAHLGHDGLGLGTGIGVGERHRCSPALLSGMNRSLSSRFRDHGESPEETPLWPQSRRMRPRKGPTGRAFRPKTGSGGDGAEATPLHDPVIKFAHRLTGRSGLSITMKRSDWINGGVA